MDLMLNASNPYFLDLYEPTIILKDTLHIASDNLAVNFFLEEIGLSIHEVKDILGFKINKNHVSIPEGTKLIIKATNYGEYNAILMEKNDITFSCYPTYEADFVMAEVIPKNKEFETAFNSTNVPKKEENVMLYNINIADLVETIKKGYGIDEKKYAYEHLKCLPKDQVLEIYSKYLYTIT